MLPVSPSVPSLGTPGPSWPSSNSSAFQCMAEKKVDLFFINLF